MVIKLKEDTTMKEIEVSIVYPQMNQAVRRIEAAVRSAESALSGLNDKKQTQFIKVADILYLESVEKRVFIYTANEVLRSDRTLLSLQEKLRGFNFVQIRKSCILNVNHLVSVRPIFNAKMEATLTNGEKVHISRKYVSMLKKKLEEM